MVILGKIQEIVNRLAELSNFNYRRAYIFNVSPKVSHFSQNRSLNS